MPTVFKSPETQTKKTTEKPAGLSFNPFASGPEKHDLLHAYCLYPTMRFETQHKDEQVILLLRAHPVTQIPWISTVAVALSLLPILSVVLLRFAAPPQMIFIIFLSFSAIFSFALLSFLSWVFNVGLITNERIIDIDYSGILYREVTASEIAEVTDVTAKSGGFTASIIDFGSVFIQTAGVYQNIDFRLVPRANEVVSIINALMQQDDNGS